MPATVVYNTLAAAGPAVQVPASLPDPLSGGVPQVFPSFTLGMDPAGMITGLQSAMLRIEAMGQRGVGIYAVHSGFAFSDGGGLTLHVGDGAACLDAYVSVKTAPGYTTVALSNGNNYVWLSHAGLFSVTNTPTAPSGGRVCLGNAVAAAGAQTAYDLSGVVAFALGGPPERITGDAGMPGDTPPAGVRFIQRSRTAAGDHLFLWDGSGYGYRQPFGTSTPATWSANQNDFALPTSTRLLRVSSSATVNLTGIAGGIDGRALYIVNVGANSVSLRNEDSGSLAANRIKTGGNINLTADQAQALVYDGTSQRWRTG